MSYLEENFRRMRHGTMRATFESLERAFQQLGIDFYLIGAFARDLWMDHLDTLPIRRTTLDIDFNVYIKDLDSFVELKKYLQEQEGFTADSEPYRMYSHDGTMIDLIPFGGLEENRMVYLDGNPPMALSVYGNMQVLTHAVNISHDGVDFKICTLPGLCILKLIASSQKPDRISKDHSDFFYILENYFDITGDLMYEEHSDLIDDNFDTQHAAARMMGRQMVPILNEDSNIKELFMKILFSLLQNYSTEEFDEIYHDQPHDANFKRMKLVACVVEGIIRKA